MMKTNESLNCPCNGIYKCAFHSIANMKLGRINIIDAAKDWWMPQHYVFLEKKELMT